MREEDAEGASGAIHYFQNRQSATETLAKVRALGSDGVVVQADVSRDEASWITGQVIHVDGGASLMDPVLPIEMQMPQTVTV